MNYRLKKITPLTDLPKKDLHALNIAVDQAYLSTFRFSLRLGACLQGKKQGFLWS